MAWSSIDTHSDDLIVLLICDFLGQLIIVVWCILINDRVELCDDDEWIFSQSILRSLTMHDVIAFDGDDQNEITI